MASRRTKRAVGAFLPGTNAPLSTAAADTLAVGEGESARRASITSLVKKRLYQRRFREIVQHAYRRQCAFCRFRHQDLLDEEDGPMLRHGLQGLHATRLILPRSKEA